MIPLGKGKRNYEGARGRFQISPYNPLGCFPLSKETNSPGGEAHFLEGPGGIPNLPP